MLIERALVRVAAALAKEVIGELCAHPLIVLEAFKASVAPILTGFCLENPELCVPATLAANAAIDKANADFRSRYCGG